MYKKILVPVDGSELSNEALREAVILARTLNAQLCLYHANVIAIPPMMSGEILHGHETVGEIFSKTQQIHAENVLSAASKIASKAEVHFTTFSSNVASAWRGIIDAAKEYRCDLILMASHGRRGFSSLLLGSETQRVLTHSDIPVLVHRSKIK